MPPCSHFSTPHGSRAVFRCLHIPGLRCFHQGGPGATNGHEMPRNHEWIEPRKTRNTRKNSGTTNGHEWTRMAMGRGEEEPRMDTNGHEWIEPRMDTNGHEWLWAGEGRFRNHETHGKPRNHEWTRMDTNGYGQGRRNHETHEIHEKTQEPRNTREAKEPRMDTNGHEWLWAGEGRFSTLWRPRPVDFQAELEKLDREREQDEESACLEDLREIVDGDTP